MIRLLISESFIYKGHLSAAIISARKIEKTDNAPIHHFLLSPILVTHK